MLAPKMIETIRRHPCRCRQTLNRLSSVVLKPTGEDKLKRIALVQNQSEMVNYSHADCRALLRQLDYSFELFTASSINTLDDRLSFGEFDCLLLASNALHDKVIRQFFNDGAGKAATQDFQCSGGGVIVLMQYKAAYEGYSFDFVLPEGEHPSAAQRQISESALKSQLKAFEKKSAPPLLHYPNRVDLALLEQCSLDHTTLPGVYWHWWEANLASAWNVHVSCISKDEPRPLLLTAQEHFGVRSILCALPIDWHSHVDLFENVLLYGCEGRHYAAAISTGSDSEPTLEYLTAKLKVRNVGLRDYHFNSENASLIFENLNEGVHNTLLLEPDVELDALFSPDQVSTLRTKIERGELRLISIKLASNAWETSVEIRGRRNPAQDAYQLIIPRISRELVDGYLDGSFRSTISGFQDLEHLPYGLDFKIFPTKQSLKESEKHDRDGSYDEVIGATAALLWLRAKTLGVDEPKTKKTAEWLRSRISRVDAREKIYALCMLEEIGLASDKDRSTAASTLNSIAAIDSSELELLAFLTGAVRFNRESTMLTVLSEFSRRRTAGAGPIWVDMPTTASLVRLLVDAYEKFPVLKDGESKSGALLTELLIPAMISIEADYERSLAKTTETGYPWDGKASTALRCLSAWYRFEQYLQAPIEEAASAVERASQEATLATFSDGAIGSLKTLFLEYDVLGEKLISQSVEIARLINSEKELQNMEGRIQKSVKVTTFLIIGILLLGYIVLDHFIRKYGFGEPLTELGHSLVKNWGQHIAVLVFLLGVFAVPWPKVFNWIGSLVDGKGNLGDNKSEDP